jgi:ABC-type Fe3+-siderophore transport system permease subunit
MKTCSLYGFISALAGALLVLALYFLGFHSDPAKLPAAKWIGGCFGLAIGIIVTALGVKARRAEIPETQPFGYGSALAAGVQISLVSSILTAIFIYLYDAFINPGFNEIILQDGLDKLQAAGISGDKLEQMEKGTRFMMRPGMHAFSTLIVAFIIGVIVSLIVAAFLKRSEPAGPPSL